MLINLSVENFKSFDEAVEFTMVESNKIRDKANHKVKIKNAEILKHAVIYGANASGKSNLIEAFRFIQFCLKVKLPFETINSFCKIKEENKNRASKFQVQFSVGERVFAYGFGVILNERNITEEWLYELTQSGNGNMIFERNCDKIEFSKSLLSDKSVATRLTTYADDFKDNKSVLFLNEMNRNKKYEADSPLSVFELTYRWLTQNIIVIDSNDSITNLAYFYDETTLDKVNRLISTFDTGITDVNIVEISKDELQRRIPKEIASELNSTLKSAVEKSEKFPTRISMRSATEFFSIEIDSKGEYKITTINLKHGNSFFDFDFEEESDGTRRIFDLIDMLLFKKEDVTFIVDELERSLHPKLTQRFLELFSRIHSNRKTQLIFTTHESSIMDQTLFRRDEIWFVERNNNNSSKLYSLDIFKERYDKKLSKAYLEGRYGAIPVFQSFDFED